MNCRVVHSSLDTIETVAADLQVVSDQLSRADLETLVEHVDQMAVTSEEGIREALLKIQAINIEELNQAIKGLSDVVSPSGQTGQPVQLTGSAGSRPCQKAQSYRFVPESRASG